LLETLHHLLYKYATTIPASTMHLADVSLYDHLRSTAAFAISLYDYLNEKNEIKKFEIEPGENPFLLIGADISGIQNFIYDIVSKSAGKNLKGRSFYLQLLIDSILQRFIKALRLYSANVVYSSGGGFYLVAPNTQHAKEQLVELETEITKKVFEAHQTNLFIAIDYQPFGEEQLFNKNIDETWKELATKLNAKKRRRYASLLVPGYSDFFEPVESGGEQVRDAITGEELQPGKKVVNIGGDDENIIVGQETYEQIQLGKELKRASYWVVSENPTLKKMYNPCKLGIYHALLKNGTDLEQKANAGNGNLQTIYSINDFTEEELNGFARGYRLYGGNSYPVVDEGDTELPKTFDMFAGSGSLKRIGYLRMDIDNLGMAFIDGFPSGRKSFSRYGALSRNLDWFFKGFINTMREQGNYREDIFIIYSGGDDLFAVGKWDVLIDFAEEVRKRFMEFSCFNKRLGISGGIAITPPKFPVMKGAKEAERAEHLAKHHLLPGHGINKNAFTLFGYPLQWDQEFKVVKQVKDQLLELIENENLSHGFLDRIYNYTDQYYKELNKGKNPRWRWLVAYDFARMQARHNSNEIKNFLNELKISIFSDETSDGPLKSGYVFLELLNIAARWTELQLRTNKTNE
jgi:CRISPR-associated protein Csm1